MYGNVTGELRVQFEIRKNLFLSVAQCHSHIKTVSSIHYTNSLQEKTREEGRDIEG